MIIFDGIVDHGHGRMHGFIFAMALCGYLFQSHLQRLFLHYQHTLSIDTFTKIQLQLIKCSSYIFNINIIMFNHIIFNTLQLLG